MRHVGGRFLSLADAATVTDILVPAMSANDA
jgi:hypothetical protein